MEDHFKLSATCQLLAVMQLFRQFSVVLTWKIAVAVDFIACYTLSNGTLPVFLNSFKLFLFDDKEKKGIWQV